MKATTGLQPVWLAVAALLVAAVAAPASTASAQDAPLQGNPPESSLETGNEKSDETSDLSPGTETGPSPEISIDVAVPAEIDRLPEDVLDRHYEVLPDDEDYPSGPFDEAEEAADSADGPPRPTAQQEPPEEQLQHYFMLYKDALDTGNYAEADMLAKRVVELAIRVHGLDSLDSARALTNLGIAQHQNEEYETAALNYNAAVDIIERVEDRLNVNLINPLKGLGAAQLASGQPDKATESFQRAVHISHVNEGPHNLMQVEILESLAETFYSVGELDDVEAIQSHIFNLEVRDVDLNSMDAIPALERQARWQHRVQHFEKERYTWRKIIGIVEKQAGKDDLSLIHPLTALGKSYLYLGQPSMAFHQPTSISSGEIYLKRALRIAENNADATWKTREQAMLALGDFYILSGKPGRARKIYSDTWELLSGDEERLRNRRDHLESLVVLQDIHPPRYVGIDGAVRNSLPGDNYKTGKIVYDYAVSNRGLTTDIERVEADPAGFEDMERAVLSNLRTMVHRPRLEDGHAVKTNGLKYTHRFFYRESDLQQARDDADLAATN